jgi:hypothetical protein
MENGREVSLVTHDGSNSHMQIYSGKVVATLDSETNHLRCRCHLVALVGGMSGGAEGECQNGTG